MIKGAAKMAALYAAIAFLWDEVVWDLGEAALFDVIAGPFFSSICFEAGTEVLMADGSLRPIEGIAVGRRVRSEPDPLAPPRAGPGDPADPNSYDGIDPATWRRVELRMEDAERGRIRMTLLRPIAWLMLVGAEVGAAVPVQLPELGLVGPAYVTAVEACPPIEEGPGRVVLSTVTHLNGDVRRVWLDGLAEPLEPTGTHRLYSEDRGDWVPVADLAAGERLRTLAGPAAITWIDSRAGVHRVYNLEVETEHCYFVSTVGVLSHNAGPCGIPAGSDLANAIARGMRVRSGESGFLEVAAYLERHCGVSRAQSGTRIHRIKQAWGLHGADECYFGLSGDVFHPYTGEHIGNLTSH